MFVSFFYMSIFVGILVYFVETDFVIVILTSVLLLASLGFFFSSNFFFLYSFFEISLFPILFMVVGYGIQVERFSAGYYLLLYAVGFSFPLLFFIFKGSEWFSGYFDNFGGEGALLISLSFLVKLPIYFLHLWLPKAHVEAPTYGSILLAGLLLKLGGVGFLRVMMLLGEFHYFIIILVGLLGSVLAGMLAFCQSDLKSLVAYSSVSHMSLMLVGLLIFSMFSKFGAVLLMLIHGFSSSSMFFLVGSGFHYFNSRKVYFSSGFIGASFFVSALYCIILVSNASIPPLLSFFSEINVLVGVFLGLLFSWVVVFLYLLYVLYFSLYFLILSLVGSGGILVSDFNYSSLLIFVLSLFNVELLFLIF